MVDNQEINVSCNAGENMAEKSETLRTHASPLIKAIALGLFILFPFVGFMLGVWYAMQINDGGIDVPSHLAITPSQGAVNQMGAVTLPSEILFVSENEGYVVGKVVSFQDRCIVDGLCIALLDSGVSITWGGDSEIPHGTIDARVSLGDSVVAFGSVLSDGRTVAMSGNTHYFLRMVDGCFLASFSEAGKSGNHALPPGASESTCPEGFARSAMRCPTSIAWCQPSDPAISILERFRVVYPEAPSWDPESHVFTWRNEDGTTEYVNGYMVQVSDMSLQDLTFGDRSVLHQLESTLEHFFLSNGYTTSVTNATNGPLGSVSGFVSEGTPGLVCVREWKDAGSEFIRYAIACGFMDSFPSDVMRRIEASETSMLSEDEVIVPNGVDLSTYRRERGL